MEAEMYGIIPNAKTEAFANAPPVKAFNRPPIPPASKLPENSASLEASIPGNTTCAPKRYTSNRPNVTIIRLRSSSIFQTFFKVSINFILSFIIVLQLHHQQLQ